MSAGKGDKQRPTDHNAYSANYDKIFKKKEVVIKKFYADWCVPCKQLTETLNEIGLVYESIDIDTDPDKQAKKYGIRSIPTLIKLEGDEQIARLYGSPSKKEVEDWLAE